jgi:hypothetical protein
MEKNQKNYEEISHRDATKIFRRATKIAQNRIAKLRQEFPEMNPFDDEWLTTELSDELVNTVSIYAIYRPTDNESPRAFKRYGAAAVAKGIIDTTKHCRKILSRNY